MKHDAFLIYSKARKSAFMDFSTNILFDLGVM